jgi:hypothetical protein
VDAVAIASFGYVLSSKKFNFSAGANLLDFDLKRFERNSTKKSKSTLQQAAGNLPGKVYCLF